MYPKTNAENRAGKTGRLKPSAGATTTPLDAGIGFALLKDRRICVWQKTRAVATGAAIMASLILVTAVAARWTAAGGRPISPALDAIALAAGSLLIGALLIKQMAPREVVSRVRCERFRVIPLRPKKTAESHRPADPQVDVLAALGYSQPVEAKEYAVIPRRTR